MSERESSAWPIICGTLAMIIVGLGFYTTFLYRQNLMNANWQRRWNDDTKALADEIRVLTQKVAEDSYGRVKFESQEIIALKARIADLTIELAELHRRTATPPTPAPTSSP